MNEFLEIDGSILEGGGQVLRNSISLSAILGIPVRILNIRANRSKPGLAPQHLKGVELVAEMCQAKLNGAHIRSTQLEFKPGKIRGGHYVADTRTAGSISLLLQVALPCAVMADGPVTLELKGGTNAEMAPQIDYMTEVFKHAVKHFGVDFNLTIHRRGYFPKGGGHVTVEVSPLRRVQAADVTRGGEVAAVYGWSYTAGCLPIKMAYSMADGAKEKLRGICKNIHIECYKEETQFAPENASGIVLTSKLSSGYILGGDALGKRGVDAVEVGRTAGEMLRDAIRSGACVDSYTQDQLIVYMALADGRSRVRVGEITLHTRTAIHFAELIAKAKFSIQPDGDQNVIECDGAGYHNRNLPV